MQDIHTVMDQRRLIWEGCHNVRDLGGLPLAGGGVTQWGKVIRSDCPGTLTEQGWESVFRSKVTRIIDLRAPKEVEAAPYRIPSGAAMEWINLPMEKFLPEVSAKIIQAQNRAEVYNIILDHYPDCIAAIMESIAAVRDGAVLLHCQAGKDRTGTITGLLLDLVGVPWNWIAADYAESQLRLPPVDASSLNPVTGAGEDGNFWLRPTATADMMFLMLEHLHQRWGSAEAYLRFAGLPEPVIHHLRHKL